MRRLTVVLLTLIIIFSSVSGVYADDEINEDPVDEVFGVLKRYYVGANSLESDITKYDSSNYYLDIKEYSALFDPLKKLTANVNSINNLLFGINKMIAKLTIFILLFAYKVNLYEMLSDHINTIIDALRLATFDKAMYTVIALMGLYSILATVFGDRKSTVLNNTIKTLVILTIAVIFLSNPSGYLSKINDFSVQVSDNLFEATYGRYKAAEEHNSYYNDNYNSEGALLSAGGMLWDVMVHKPWQSLVLGKTTDDKLTKEILSKNPYDSDRIDKIKDLAYDNSLLRLEGIFTRFGALLLFTVFNIVLGIIVTILSSLSLIAQAMVVIFSFLAPFIFLIALIPRFSNILGSWGMKLAGYSFIKIFISLALAILLVMNAAIFENIESNGLIVTLIIMALMTFAVYHSRDKLVSIIKAIPKGGRNVRREIKNPSQATDRVRDYKSIVKGYTKDKVQAVPKLASKGINKAKTKSVNMGARAKETSKSFYDKRRKEKYKEMSEEYLNRKYREEKEKSELKASRLGRDKVDYSDFVKQADTREKLEKEKFTESQINHVTKIIRKIELEGDDPNKFINGEEITKESKPIEKKLNVNGYTDNLSNTQLVKSIGRIDNQIKKLQSEDNNNLPENEKDKKALEMYKLWQQKYELSNALKGRKLDKQTKKYKNFSEYDELKNVRKQVKDHLKDMSKIFNDKDFKGDRLKAFNKELNVQVKLKNKEDNLIKTLKAKENFSTLRNKTTTKEEEIVNKYGRDKIKNKELLVHENEDYKKDLESLKNLYTEENKEAKNLKGKDTNVKELNGKLNGKLDLENDEVESLLISRTKYKDNKAAKEDLKGSTKTGGKDPESKGSNKKRREASGSSKERPTKQPATKEKIIKKPVKIEKKLDVNRLEKRDEEILDELHRQSSNNSDSNKNKGVNLEQEHFERLGEEIFKNVDKNKSTVKPNVTQNINQNVVIKSAKEFDKQFNKQYDLKNNQVFFENLVKRYGAENVKTEMTGMKNNKGIKNPKGMLITRLKNNHKPKE